MSYIFRMYSHPQGGRFVPNITPIPGQNYVYHPSSVVHPGLQNTQIVPSSALPRTISAYSQPQTTNTAAPSPVYHPSPPPVPVNLQQQYMNPVETHLQPIQTPSISIKIEKSADDTFAGAGLYQRNQPTIIQKDLNPAHQNVLAANQQATIVVHDGQLIQQRSEQEAEISRQQGSKILLQQQQTNHQQIIAIPVPGAEITLTSQVQKEQQERENRERREREIQRQKVIEDHQKQKNSNRIFSNSTKNMIDVPKFDINQALSKTTSSIPVGPNSAVTVSPAEHGFRKITAPAGTLVQPKIRSPPPNVDVKVYKCIMCGFVAESAALLGRHAFEIHEKRSKKWRIGQKFPTRHECDECDYETPDIHRLHRHMQRVHDTDQVFHFQCKECDFVATSADLLGRHALEVHEAGSVFRCSLCDFSSNRKSDRDKHYTGAHQLDYETYVTSSVNHKKVSCVGSSSDADTSFSNNRTRKRRKRRGRPLKRPKRCREDWNQSDTEEEAEELKKELKELRSQTVVEEDNECNASNHAASEEEIEVKEELSKKEKPLECDLVLKTIEKILGKEGEDTRKNTCDIFPKKCNLCCDIFDDKFSMIDHIRNKHILKSCKATESTKRKFEIIRQKPSKCLEIINEENSKV